MASGSLTIPLQEKKKVPRTYLTREIHRLLDKLGVVYGIRSRTKLLETLILNQMFVVAETPREQMKGKKKAALDFCKKFAAEYEKRLKVIDHDRQGIGPTVGR